MSIFRSAIQGDDGQVDAGYLGLYAVMVLMLGAIPSAIVLVAIRLVVVAEHPLDLLGLAAVIAAAATGFGTAAAGVGLFRAGDKPHAQAASTTTTRTQETTTSAGATTDDPLKVALVPNKKAVKKRGR